MAKRGARGCREGNTNSFMIRESHDGGRQARQVGDYPYLACGSPPGAALLPRGHCVIPEIPLIVTVGDATGI